MRIAFSKRAVEDIRGAAEYSRREFGDLVAAELETRIQAVLAHLQDAPESGLRLEQRPNIRVIRVGRYPYRIFYRISGKTLLILHLRHTARQSWVGQ